MTKIDDIDLKANYTFNNGITVNADSLQRAEEKKQNKQKKKHMKELKKELRLLM